MPQSAIAVLLLSFEVSDQAAPVQTDCVLVSNKIKCSASPLNRMTYLTAMPLTFEMELFADNEIVGPCGLLAKPGARFSFV